MYQMVQYVLGKLKEVSDVLKKLFFAWILIQISWFLMATAIDLSSIAIYGIWGLPLAIKQNIVSEDWNSKKEVLHTFGTYVNLDFNTDGTDEHFQLFLTTTWKKYISSCRKDLWSENTWFIIKWPSHAMITFKDGSTWFTLTGRCHDRGALFHFDWNTLKNTALTGCEGKTLDFCLKSLYGNTSPDVISGLVADHAFLSYKDAMKYLRKEENGKLEDYGFYTIEEFQEWLWKQQDGLFSLDTLIEQSQSYLGVFQSLYNSLLNVVNFNVDQYGDQRRFISQVINFFYLGMLVIPLVAIDLVLCYRIYILWISIVILPILILFRCFGKKQVYKEQSEQFEIENIARTIFSPVIFCFAISMATVLISCLHTFIYNNSYSFEWSSILFDFSNLKGLLEDMLRTWIGFVGVALTWVIMFAAIKSVSVWKAVWETFDKLWRSFVWNLKVIPFPFAQWNVSYNTLFKDGSGVVDQLSYSLEHRDEVDESTISSVKYALWLGDESDLTTITKSYIDNHSDQIIKTNFQSHRTDDFYKSYIDNTVLKFNVPNAWIQEMSFKDLLSNENFKKAFEKNLPNDYSSQKWNNTLEMIPLQQKLYTAKNTEEKDKIQKDIDELVKKQGGYDEDYIRKYVAILSSTQNPTGDW